MANNTSEPNPDPSSDRNNAVPERPSHPFLRVRPKHFFSTKFDTEIVEVYSKADIEERKEAELGIFGRFVKHNLLLMILVIGVPILVYCILTTAS